MPKTPQFLMTAPDHFEVSYKINPWMAPEAWRREASRNQSEAYEAWGKLRDALRQAGASVTVLDGVIGLPDMVFPANAAVVLDGKVLVSRFRFPERQGEEAHFLAAFRRLQAEGHVREVSHLPPSLWQEGAGDCVWDEARQIFWAGFGPRSSLDGAKEVERYFDIPVVPLELISERFYHLDTAFVPLGNGEILFYPPAFSNEALQAICRRVPPESLIEASAEDAARLAVNAVVIGRNVIMAEPTVSLADQLEHRGYRVLPINLRPFIMAGGGAYCMTLRLDRQSAASQHELRRP